MVKDKLPESVTVTSTSIEVANSKSTAKSGDNDRVLPSITNDWLDVVNVNVSELFTSVADRVPTSAPRLFSITLLLEIVILVGASFYRCR
ncbi:hypothetical protein [Psychrosphaera haliotis]|uniref:hypothetical protein n=1 Tax=Psychrosphaera haliotis TaxID=555083 RepID=UPI001E42D460|nr:hypothetical protein [Psychrosphaera haliotis]